MKSLVLVCLLTFDFELLDCVDSKGNVLPDTRGKVPVAAQTRAGLGAMQPKGDVMVKMTPRANAVELLIV